MLGSLLCTASESGLGVFVGTSGSSLGPVAPVAINDTVISLLGVQASHMRSLGEFQAFFSFQKVLLFGFTYDSSTCLTFRTVNLKGGGAFVAVLGSTLTNTAVSVADCTFTNNDACEWRVVLVASFVVHFLSSLVSMPCRCSDSLASRVWRQWWWTCN